MFNVASMMVCPRTTRHMALSQGMQTELSSSVDLCRQRSPPPLPAFSREKKQQIYMSQWSLDTAFAKLWPLEL